MKYYLIAGEASGDLHASNLMLELQKQDPNAEFRFYGGDKMASAGGTLVRHYRDMAIMGIVEALKNLNRFNQYIAECTGDINRFNPDVVILVDYAGFNLRMAKRCHLAGFSVYYYIAPKLWAWGKSRAGSIEKYVERIFVILPFETGFYKSLGITAEYHGNPVVEEVQRFQDHYNESGEEFRKRNQLDNRPIVALLAGSRKQEIDLCLPVMLNVSERYPHHQFVVAGAPSIQDVHYEKHLEGTAVKVIKNQTYALLKQAEAAIVTSGTATLETALLGIPQVIIYKASWGSYTIGKLLILFGVIHVKFFGLVNIITDRIVVKEFFQHALLKRTAGELECILTNEGRRREIMKGYRQMSELLGYEGASQRTAQSIVNYLKTH